MALTLNDGASEISFRKKASRPLPIGDIEKVANLIPGGKIGNLATPRRDFAILRQSGRAPLKLSLTHAATFKGLWKLWLEKRLANAQEKASTAAELSEKMNVPETTVREALYSLVSSGVVRQHEGFVSRTQRRLLFTPLQKGIELLALVDYLGEGSLLQVGKKVADWERSEEPPNVFAYAELLKGK